MKTGNESHNLLFNSYLQLPAKTFFFSLQLTIAFLTFSCNSDPVIFSAEYERYTGSREIIYLKQVTDQFNGTIDVYTDLDAAGNHFAVLAKMGDASTMDVGCTVNPHSGVTCIKVVYNADDSWSGWYFMNGILKDNSSVPEANWGTVPNAGYNLEAPDVLTFYARGENGGENVEFFAAGVGWNLDTGQKLTGISSPDSSPKISSGYITLTKEWKQYSIKTKDRNLTYTLGGFGWAASGSRNSDRRFAFYLDDIQYHTLRLNEPHLLISYEFEKTNSDFDKVMHNVSFVYDDALALMAFLSEGEADYAKLIADAFVYIVNNDRYYEQGRIRNGYMGGDLKTAPGWITNGKANTCRIPGWTEDNKWNEDSFVVSTHTGNAAWMMLGLLSYYQYTNNTQNVYLEAAKAIGNWVSTNCENYYGAGGYTAGFSGWDGKSVKLNYKATEHNIDLYAAFERLYLITGDVTWKFRAEHAKIFVNAMYDKIEGKFYTGTGDDGVSINTAVIPLDIQAWAILSLKDEYKNYLSALDFAERKIKSPMGGYSFSQSDLSSAWLEGTGQMAAAFYFINEPDKADALISFIKSTQDASGGIYATSSGLLATGFDWTYFHKKHVGATAWYILSKNKKNPFWLGS